MATKELKQHKPVVIFLSCNDIPTNGCGETRFSSTCVGVFALLHREAKGLLKVQWELVAYATQLCSVAIDLLREEWKMQASVHLYNVFSFLNLDIKIVYTESL